VGAHDLENHQRLSENIEAILRESSLRYGKRLYGYGYLDECLTKDYPLDPHWENWARAIKAGNPDALISFSSNKGPSYVLSGPKLASIPAMCSISITKAPQE
jgi:hypothetical protein